VPNISI